MADNWKDYKNNYAASPEERKDDYEKVRQGAISASPVSASDIANKLKKTWLNMVGTKPEDTREEK